MSKSLRNVVKLNGLAVNVREFGAKGDGVTDDSAAINAAIAAAGDYGTIYIPPHEPGQYYKAKGIAPLVGQRICGAGMLNTQIRFSGGTTPIFNVVDNDAGACNVFLQDMQIYFPAPGGSTAHCINYGSGQNTLHLERVWLAGGYAGLYAAGGEVEVTQCVFENNGTYGFWGDEAYQVRLVNNWFGAAGTNCIRLAGASSQSIEVIGNYITDAAQDAISVDGVDGLTITANMFRENGLGSTNTYSNIALTNVGPVAIVGNTATVVSGADVRHHIKTDVTVNPQYLRIGLNAFEPAKTSNYNINSWPAGTPTDLPSVFYGTAIPTGGTYRAGDLVVNVAPALGGPVLWVCSVAGTPGTWLAITAFNYGTFSATGVTEGRTFVSNGRWEQSSTDGAALTPHQAFYNTNGQVGGIYTLNSATQFRPTIDRIWTAGAGTPEGSITATIGSLYTRTDGGANTTLYVKESGTGNTGWVAK